MALFTRLFQNRLPRLMTATALLSSAALLSSPPPAQAGCGCTKPPPELASVRPNATYAGTEVTLFHASLQAGQDYSVTFSSGTQPGHSATVTVQAVTRRDLADAQDKPQLVVALPNLPLGPTSISVTDQNETVFSLADAAFTVAPQPIVFPETVGEVSLPDYKAAVSRNGVVYISLDVTDMHLPRTFNAQAVGYPLRFTNDEVVFYNTQGFMMQLLDEGMPGLFAIDAATGSPDSDTLQYSRHEFNTHFLQHAERQAHGVDASDPNWHEDGTPHIDHDHLIIAISGMLDDGSLPIPGATPLFDLAVSTATFFQHGIVGEASVEMEGGATVNSYNSQDGSFDWQGQVLSNGPVTVAGNADIYGDAIGATVAVQDSATISGDIILTSEPVEFLPVDIPNGLEDLGRLEVKKTTTLSPGSYRASAVIVEKKGHLIIDNTAGPVTLYVTGNVKVFDKGQISTTDANPEKFAIYVAGSHTVRLGKKGQLYGVVYAPESLVKFSSTPSDGGEFFGAIVGKDVHFYGNAQVHYDTVLRGE